MVSFAEWLSFIASPRPTIIFKYDKERQEYLPANHRFVARSLKGVNEEIKRIKELNQMLAQSPDDYRVRNSEEYRSLTLDVFFTYVYAGRRNRAWAFYHRFYRLQDKKQLRSNIHKLFAKDALYRAIYAAKP
jgi:hypothetical protein